jgi:hypothetical protein
MAQDPYAERLDSNNGEATKSKAPNIKTSKNSFFNRLKDSRQRAWRDLEPFRRADLQIKKQLAGHMYGNNRQQRENPVVINMMQQYMQIYLRMLASGTPNVMIETPYPDLQPIANAFELNLNRRVSEIKLQETVSKVVMDAIVSIGICKIGYAKGDDEYAIDGHLYNPGEVFCDAVDVNDFVVDLQERSHRRVDFIGDRFRIPKDYAEEMLGKKLPSESQAGEFDSMYQAEPRIDTEARMDGTVERVYDTVWGWDLWLPKENAVMTFVDNEDEPVKVVEWDGPEAGPYEWLRYMDLAGSVLPVAPAQSLYEMHMFINELMRKQSRQGNRQKSVLLYEEAASDDAMQLQKANDGDMLCVKDVQRFHEAKFGGGDPQNQNLLMWTLQRFSLSAGNLDSLAGLGPQSETAKQDQMLAASASAMVDAMQDTTIEFIENIVKQLAWYEWTEDIRAGRMMMYSPEYTDITIPVTFSKEEREGDFLDYNFKIHPHSLRKFTPEERIQQLVGLMNNLVLPTAPMAQQAGMIPNIEGIMKQIAKLSQIPFETLYSVMDDTVSAMTKPGQEPQPGSMGPATRTYERVSRPGTTPHGTDNEMMRSNASLSASNA